MAEFVFIHKLYVFYLRVFADRAGLAHRATGHCTVGPRHTGKMPGKILLGPHGYKMSTVTIIRLVLLQISGHFFHYTSTFCM